jgi:hypothetical protein
MRTSDAFILGAITGGAVVWFWRRELEDSARDKTRGVRTHAVAGLQAVADRTEKVLDRGGDALRRAEEVLQDTKEHVRETLHKGQDAIRPAPSAREA